MMKYVFFMFDFMSKSWNICGGLCLFAVPIFSPCLVAILDDIIC